MPGHQENRGNYQPWPTRSWTISSSFQCLNIWQLIWMDDSTEARKVAATKMQLKTSRSHKKYFYWLEPLWKSWSTYERTKTKLRWLRYCNFQTQTTYTIKKLKNHLSQLALHALLFSAYFFKKITCKQALSRYRRQTVSTIYCGQTGPAAELTSQSWMKLQGWFWGQVLKTSFGWGQRKMWKGMLLEPSSYRIYIWSHTFVSL